MYKFQLLLILIFVILVPSAFSLHCLVIRPGYGLVTEKCPHGSVGCRIRISKDAVDFYEFSALYDRNQYVCVHKSEFDEAKQSGCLRKKSGRVRCWCYGRGNCNTAEASKTLYEAFVSDDKDHFNKVIKEIDSSPPVTDFSPPISVTTHAPEVVKVPIVRKNKGGMLRGGLSPSNKPPSASGSIRLGMSENVDGGQFVRNHGSRKVDQLADAPKKAVEVGNRNEGDAVFSKSSGAKKHEEHRLRHHHYRTEDDKENQSKRLTSSRGTFSNKEPEEVQRQSILVEKDFPTTHRPTVKSHATTEISTVKTKVVLDSNNEVHVITVGAQDQYDLQNGDAATESRILPTEVTSDDLYDEEELARLDAEYAEQQKRQNRPIPAPEVPTQAVRVLPQEDDDVSEEIPQPEGEYFDANSASAFHYSSISLLLALLVRVL